MVTLNIDKDDCKNVAELIELYLPQFLHDAVETGDFDNIDYLRSMVRAYDAITEAAKGGEV